MASPGTPRCIRTGRRSPRGSPAEATDDWNDRVAVDRFVGKSGRFVRGRGRLTGPGRVEVGDTVFEACRAVVLATGTQPAVPPIEGLADTPYWTNRDAIQAKTLPASLIVLGGGAIGLELAQAYARFGVEVTVVEALDRLLAAEEPESSALAAEALTREGITVRTEAKATRVSYGGGRSPSRWVARSWARRRCWWPPRRSARSGSPRPRPALAA